MAPRTERCLWVSDKHQKEEMENHCPRYVSLSATPTALGTAGQSENSLAQRRKCVPLEFKAPRSPPHPLSAMGHVT